MASTIYTYHVYSLRHELNTLSFHGHKSFHLHFHFHFLLSSFFFLLQPSPFLKSQFHNMNGKNGYREDSSYCYFHPKEVVVGVCSLCLTERLLILAAKKGHHKHHHHHHHASASSRGSTHRSSQSGIPKIFAFSSFLNRLEFPHWKPADNHSVDQDASTSQEDSFISIKFEENGVASWEKNKVSKVSLDHCNMSWNHNFNKETKCVIEHGKSHTPLRWRKRIGHLFQLIRWKRSNKGNACHVNNKVEGVKVRKQGWIRSLTKKRTME